MSDHTTAAASAWRDLASTSVRLFHQYANWLVGISWKRFAVLSLGLLIISAILGSLLPQATVTEWTDLPTPPRPPAPRKPTNAERHGSDGGYSISIDKNGVRIAPRPAATPSASIPSSGGTPASAPADEAAASAPELAASAGTVEIKLPPGATSDAVREAVDEARQAIVDAMEESRQASRDAADAAAEAADASRQAERQYLRVRKTDRDNPFPPIAWLFIIASAILKATYKGRLQAEVKAAAATETAESEQLKRQVVEARMAAMQAQVEPHFLFNTLASIDHLIETDPTRASQMQKNLIALLRASMPTMRESHPAAHNLGREMAVIRPYLEILKVRMEDRLQTEIAVPDGLLSADFPSMMIQSLVENAIKHGLEPKPEGGKLTVRAEIVHGKLAVTVADTGLGFGKAATAGTGVGLNNIRERLQLLYGSKASMTVAENPPSGTVVTLTVPYQAQPRDGETA
jgi:signal transduction histidine kinase